MFMVQPLDLYEKKKNSPLCYEVMSLSRSPSSESVGGEMTFSRIRDDIFHFLFRSHNC